MNVLMTEAIVLKNFRYNESSKIVTLYSENSGKFAALVKGTRSLKSRLSGCFETGNLVNISFIKKENRELQFINKCDCIDAYSVIKSNLKTLEISYRIVELTNGITECYDINHNFFNLIKKCFYAMEKNILLPEYVYLYFLFWGARYLGIDFSSDLNFLTTNYVYNSKSVKDSNISNILTILNNTDIFTARTFYFDMEKIKTLSEKYEMKFEDYAGKKISFSKNVFNQLNN